MSSTGDSAGVLSRVSLTTNATTQTMRPQEVISVPHSSKTSFSIYQDLPMNYKCEGYGYKEQPCSTCKILQPLMKYLGVNQDQIKTPNLFIVPMDYLAILSTDFPDYSARILGVMDNVMRRQHYLRFGGSDHIFLCLSQGCKQVMLEIVERYTSMGLICVYSTLYTLYSAT